MDKSKVKEAIQLTNLLITDEKDEINLSELFKNDEKIVDALSLLQKIAQSVLNNELVEPMGEDDIFKTIKEKHIFTDGQSDTDVFVTIPIKELAHALSGKVGKEVV